MPPLSADIDLTCSTHNTSNSYHLPSPRKNAQQQVPQSPISIDAVHDEQAQHPHRQQRPRKSVTFDPVVRGRHILRLKDYTSQEKQACWLTSTESEAIRTETRRCVLELTNNPHRQDDDEFCRRGLVRHLPDVAKERSDMKLRAREVVLNEQELQMSEGSFDPDFIACVYGQESVYAQEAAYVRADHDEWDAWVR